MFDLITTFVAATASPFENLITTIRGIIIVPLAFVIGILALMRGIKGRFMDMIIILAIGVVGIIFLYSPEILTNLGESTGTAIEGGL